MNYLQEKENEIVREINKMSMEELLYLDLNPNFFVYNKLKKQIEEIQAQNKQVQMKQEKYQNIANSIANEDMKETLMLKDQIEKLYLHINKLLAEKEKLNYKIPKNEFLSLLENELKKYDNPDMCFLRLKDKIIDLEEFEKQFAELGKGNNYYYYKLIYKRIKND